MEYRQLSGLSSYKSLEDQDAEQKCILIQRSRWWVSDSYPNKYGEAEVDCEGQ